MRNKNRRDPAAYGGKVINGRATLFFFPGRFVLPSGSFFLEEGLRKLVEALKIRFTDLPALDLGPKRICFSFHRKLDGLLRKQGGVL